MKRVTTMLLTVTAAVLLGGCVADFDEGHRHGRRWDDRDDDRRDGRRYYRDRDDD